MLGESRLMVVSQNLAGKYSTTDIFLEGDLHTRVLQTKLTPNISQFINVIQDELDSAISLEVPQSDGNESHRNTY
jgi:hypothetical protein